MQARNVAFILIYAGIDFRTQNITRNIFYIQFKACYQLHAVFKDTVKIRSKNDHYYNKLQLYVYRSHDKSHHLYLNQDK